jgi:hypothetical protein
MVVAGVTVESLAPIQRLTVTMAEFATLLAKTNPTIGPELLAKIKRTCIFLKDGRVNVPARIE